MKIDQDIERYGGSDGLWTNSIRRGQNTLIPDFD